MEDLCLQQHRLQRHHHRQLQQQNLQNPLMTQLGVEFKPDLCEKVLQPREYKKHIASGVIQRQRHLRLRDLAYYQSGLHRIYSLQQQHQRLRRLRHHHRQRQQQNLQNPLMTQLGVEFKPD